MQPSRDSFSSSKERSSALATPAPRSLEQAVEKARSFLRFENIKKYRSDDNIERFIEEFFTHINLSKSNRVNIKSIKFNLSVLYDKVNELQNNCTQNKFKESRIFDALIQQICQNVRAELEFQKRTAHKKRENNEQRTIVFGAHCL